MTEETLAKVLPTVKKYARLDYEDDDDLDGEIEMEEPPLDDLEQLDLDNPFEDDDSGAPADDDE